jgi:hypothetical protein
MNHSFDVDIATRYGLQEAIFIENIRFWVLKNKANKKHFHKGKYWTYNSAKAYAELFPYWSQQQIERIISKLKSAGVIEVDNFNSNTYDRTNWYTLNDEMLSSKSMDGNIKIDESSNTYIKPVVNNKESSNAFFDEFWKAYPRKTNKGFARKVFEKLKVDDVMLTKMITAIYVQNKNVWKDKDQQYIPHPSTWLNGERWDDEVVVKPMSASDREKARIFG